MATSPCVRPPLRSSAKAGSPLANSAAPMAPAPPTASPLRKKERRLVEIIDGQSLVEESPLTGSLDFPSVLPLPNNWLEFRVLIRYNSALIKTRTSITVENS